MKKMLKRLCTGFLALATVVMSMLPTLMKFDNLIGDNNEWLEKQKQVNEYLQPALELYFQNAGINAFEGV